MLHFIVVEVAFEDRGGGEELTTLRSTLATRHNEISPTSICSSPSLFSLHLCPVVLSPLSIYHLIVIPVFVFISAPSSQRVQNPKQQHRLQYLDKSILPFPIHHCHCVHCCLCCCSRANPPSSAHGTTPGDIIDAEAGSFPSLRYLDAAVMPGQHPWKRTRYPLHQGR